jgi:hypothetical protein
MTQTALDTESIDRIRLVFKTHLDLGFTDFANRVYRHYMDHFIPAAIQLAHTVREQGMEERFVWTTGSWLIYHFLEEASPAARKQMEDAIAAGDITWHALPFTMHCEVMDAGLFRFGLSLSKRLDERFGHTTIAAKMTDVPGHTRSIVPLMTEAGIRLLHIGVNEASTMPHVPPVFVWRDEASGSDMQVIYEHHYGGLTQVNGLKDALAIHMTGDNMGPPTVSAVQAIYARLRQQHPAARIIPSTLDHFAAALEGVKHQLPVITDEIGDSWIHGAGTDPNKMRLWREWVRLRREIVPQAQTAAEANALFAFQDALLCVAEHTWGMDTKLHLADWQAYTASELRAARTTSPFLKMESSWEEQRHYLDQAVTALEGTRWHTAATALAPLPTLPAAAAVPTSEMNFSTPLFDITLDTETGAISHLVTRHDGETWASPDHPLAVFGYQLFDQSDYDRFWDEYIQGKDHESIVAWSQYDYGKQGVAGKSAHIPLSPAHLIRCAVEQQTDRLLVIAQLAFPSEWTEYYGAPPRATLTYGINHNLPQIDIHLAWSSKPASRLPEALWMSFSPLVQNGEWRFEKLGQWIDPLKVVSGGNRGLHAVFDRVRCTHANKHFTLYTYDAPLVAPGAPSLLRFTNHLPDLNRGVHVNLWNNAWGTNFPQWLEGDSSFRFRMEWA